MPGWLKILASAVSGFGAITVAVLTSGGTLKAAFYAGSISALTSIINLHLTPPDTVVIPK